MKNDTYIIQVDGRTPSGSGALKRTAEGVLYGHIAEAIRSEEFVVGEYMGHVAAGDGGAFVYVPKGVSGGRFEITYALSACTEEHPTLLKTLIVLEKGASAEITCEVQCAGQKGYVVTSHRHVALEADSHLVLNELLRVCENGELHAENHVRQMDGSVLRSITAELGAGVSALKYVTDLAGRHIESTHRSLFLARGRERTEFDVTVNHLMPDCQSNVLVKGVASQGGYGKFKGMVFVAQDAQKTQAYQQSRNLLLDTASRIETSPQLEIYADDVKCSHGATVGQMNDDALFYMRQRGLDELQARKLQLKGFVEDVFMGSEDAGWREKISQLAEAKISEM